MNDWILHDLMCMILNESFLVKVNGIDNFWVDIDPLLGIVSRSKQAVSLTDSPILYKT